MPNDNSSAGNGRPTGRTTSIVQPARRIALEVITAVREDDAYANLLLPTKLARAKLSTADAALATELSYGTLRMRGYYDRVISLAAGRPVENIDPVVLDVLELAVHQLLGMRTATHAAVNESVELARLVASRSATGFVNGVLRTITRTDADTWLERVLETAKDDDARLSAEYSHPVWIIRAFRRALVADGVRPDQLAAELRDLLDADNLPPRLGLVALPGLADRTQIDVPGREAKRSPFGFIATGGDPIGIPQVAAGTVRVQDEGSQLAALALSRAAPVNSGEKWLDLCAGPGGKSALLAAEARLGGAILTANEPVPARAQLVRNALAAIPDPPAVWQLDGTVVGRDQPESFDRILVDAPCTGLGALRRRPEARWRKSPRDVAELAELQTRLIDSAIEALRPGGILAYVTCSPHVAETRGQVAGAIERWGDRISQLDTAAVLAGVSGDEIEAQPSGSQVQLWPHTTATDAMFIALFTKNEVAR
ncbi:RsmB/NOP family class I SAM-dependent RNA methyltransferase [Agreia sp. COWG]|uniref:RsmB/NOP family class I SAM-dependent RNA methyltransferase n=1 Tax=Agreia sp. COWG TaxID=2773266 RepID=UPI0019279BE9|nr:transcription antitermination factor NusB [Agreia sp. COWG]CAD5998345.1 Ribosomal RNA small subunit methyltransferase B [Agreia sp. COWG]